MALDLIEVRRLAGDVAREEDPALEVVGATSAEGGPNYAEIIVAFHRQPEPLRLVIGIKRDAPEPVVRGMLRDRLREHLHEFEPS
jgi:hypothetical protein